MVVQILNLNRYHPSTFEMNGNSNSSHPLRPYYQPQDDSTFIASAPSTSSAAPRVSGSSKIGAGIRSTSNPTSTSTTLPSNKYISNDLYSQDYSNNNNNNNYSSISDLTSAALTALALQYTSTCLAMPFEVGKLLLQVQWVPTDQVWKSHAQIIRSRARLNKRNQLKRQREERRRNRLQTRNNNLGRLEEINGDDQDDEQEEDQDESELEDDFDQQERHELAPEAEEWQDEQQGRSKRRDFGAEADELSDSDEAEAYFRDLSSQSTRPTGSSSFNSNKTKRPTDESGYMIRRNLNDEVEGTKPEFVMPIVVKGGVLEMMKAVGRGKEGWFGLLKGTFTTFILDNAFNTIQPLLSGFFSLFTTTSSVSRNMNLSITYSPYPFKSLTILLSSHLLTGVLLSPLDLIRTRLIAQSTLSSHKKYKGPYNALQQILKTEGGWRTIYLHPNLLIPTILDYTFRPLFNLSIPLMIEYWLHVEPNLNPITYALVELILNSMGLLITLPIETVRRRLQLQLRAPWGKVPDFKTPVNSNNPVSNDISTSSSNRNIPLKTYVNQTGLGGKNQIPTIVKPEIDYEKRPLRTCVETRPEPYAGVVEAIYKILTEETSLSHKSSEAKGRDEATDQEKEKEKTKTEERRKRNESVDSNSSMNFMTRSGIIAKTGNSSLGGLSSLYRGLTMGLSANLVVFVLTLVGAERDGSSGKWAEI